MPEPVSESEGNGGSSETPPGVPRWVTVSALVVLVVALVLVVVMLLVGGEHGPGLHTGAGDLTGIVTLIVIGPPHAL